jgi:rhodanese-related sulfurtransferase
MRRTIIFAITVITFLGILTPVMATEHDLKKSPVISGRIEGGYRILLIPQTSDMIHVTVYRGDYVKFYFDESMGNPELSIPDLSIQKTLPNKPEVAPFFKMKQAGLFTFSLGELRGQIQVVEYQQPHYSAITAKEAADIVNQRKLLLLDVRTPGEYKRGHLENALLIPLQELQTRWEEIAAYKNQDIVIYCATGNRSTVASKILIDHGFKRIYNLRYGIKDWIRRQYPVIQ